MATLNTTIIGLVAMRTKILIAVVCAFFLPSASGAVCTTTLNSGANINTAISAASAGDEICLNDGSYTVTGQITEQFASYVTIKSVNTKGATVDLDINPDAPLNGFTFWGAEYIKIDNVILSGSYQPGGCSNNLQITNSTINAKMYFVAPDCGSGYSFSVLIDGNIINNVAPSTASGMIGINSSGDDNNFTISNNTFTGGNECSDGINVQAGGGITVGPGNTFSNFYQTGCANHVDAYQDDGGGGPNNAIINSYFYNNAVHIGIYDGTSGAMSITGNVFQECDEPQCIQIGGVSGMNMSHNTFYNMDVSIGSKSAVSPNSNWTLNNNIFDNSTLQTAASDQEEGVGSGSTIDYNLNSNSSTISLVVTPTNTVTGAAVYSGTPLNIANWNNWQLASGSPGENAGDDSADMGTLYYGTQPILPPILPPTMTGVCTGRF